MKIVKATDKNIYQAAQIIKRGGVVVFPTDTSYGMGGLYDSQAVIKKILKIKNRRDKKFTLVAASLSQVEKFFKLNSAQRKLAQKYWPGPVSLVVSNQFAIRVPKNKVAQTLARRVGKPIIATSANISGQKPVFSIKEFENQFYPLLPSPFTLRLRSGQERARTKAGVLPDLVLDAGKLSKNKPSDIVAIVDNQTNKIR